MCELIDYAYFPEEIFHVFAFERRFESAHLIEETPKTPYIALLIVRFIAPDFRRCEVRRACLRVEQPIISELLRHIEIAQHDSLA